MPSQQAVIQLDPIETRDHGVYADGDGTLHFTDVKPATSRGVFDVDWVLDTDRRLQLGDLVRGVLEISVELPREAYAYSKWVDAFSKDTEAVDKLWNDRLAEKGESTAFQIVAMRESRFVNRDSDNVFRVEFEFVARVVHNGLILWVAVALLGAVLYSLAEKSIEVHGGKIKDVSSKGLGYVVGEVVGEAGAGALKPLFPFAVAGFILWRLVR